MIENRYWKRRIEEWTSLETTDRISEVLYGLLICLTFTGTIRISTGGTQELNSLLWAALGGSFAWALSDAIMYLVNIQLERGHELAKLKKIVSAMNSENARNEVKKGIHPFIDLMDDNQIDALIENLRKQPELPSKPSLVGKDFLISAEIFVLVFTGTLPVAAPFFLIENVALAVWISNTAVLLMLFIGGFILAKYAGFKPITTACWFTAIGVFLISAIILLGG
jgi:VIT1/CCC1 family predicted Fe2+/Mn2+ transporter